MSTDNVMNWIEANRNYLSTAIRIVKQEMENFSAGQKVDAKGKDDAVKKTEEARKELALAADALSSPSTLGTLDEILGLTTFEQKILLMCAGLELDPDFAVLLSELQGSQGLSLPSFSLAMNVFSDAHWSALSPERPLRYWRLIDFSNTQILTRSPFRIDEQILHYLTGIFCLDERLSAVTEPELPDHYLAPSQLVLAEKIVATCIVQAKNMAPLPVFILTGNEGDKTGIAAMAASRTGRRLYSVSAYALPSNKDELSEFIRLWNREAALNDYAIYLDTRELDAGDRTRMLSLEFFIENTEGLIFTSSEQRVPGLKRPAVTIDVSRPTRNEQLSLWRSVLADNVISRNGSLDKLVSQFNLSADKIQRIGMELQASNTSPEREKKENPDELKRELWRLCCRYSRPGIEDMAQRIEPVATWDDIVLPEAQKELLREIAVQARQRKKVYDDWGFEAKASRGLGISALFTGESGTGKTMAAEVLANELQLDLYRIDLSQVVNKYIGETEKNLKKIFDTAEEGGAILLFDEADALFGKRSEVKDSHDRYSNIEVSYLLQRMEAYHGLAILTTNMKSALDKAFLRRIRFLVQFPFPDKEQREKIWEKVFPADTPVNSLDLHKLARLNIPGGNIKNIALNAAFIAADQNSSVGMNHILKAARTEYSKLEKSLNTIEIE